MTTTKKIMIYGAIALGIAGILRFAVLPALSGGDAKGREFSASAISTGDRSFDFGTISMAKGKVTRTFTIKNEGPDPIDIIKVYTSCMCTTASLVNEKGERQGYYGMPGHNGGSSEAHVIMKPGETMNVETIFDPAAHGPSGVGLAQRSVYVETNSRTQPKVEFNFSAQVTP